MDKLINIIEKDGKKLVSARELYDFLEVYRYDEKKNKFVGTEFSKWCERMFEYGFAEDVDYSLVKIGERSAHNKIDYALTINTAKEISMLQRSEKGKQARQYFIECETKLERVKELTVQYKAPSEDELIIAGMKALNAKAERLETQLQLSKSIIQEQAPKVQYHDEVLHSNSTFPTTVIAKELEMSAIELNRTLKSRGILMRVSGVWVLTAKYQNFGYTKTRTHTYTDGHGQQQTSIQTVWTEKGRKFIHDTFKMELVAN